jgi:hypothetical protein
MRNYITILGLAIAASCGLEAQPALSFPVGSGLPDYIRTQDVRDICGGEKTSEIRHVSEKLKHLIYERDLVPGGNHTGRCDGPGGCEVDHRIALEVGGSNSESNLIVQPYFGACNAHDKDKLENRLHRLICERVVTPEYAQDILYNNWESGYIKFIDPEGCRD